MFNEVLFLEEAKTEFTDTVDYYENIFSGLGLDFNAEVKKVIDLITEFPDIFQKRKDGTQRISTHRFPYQIVFFSHRETLWVISVAHHKRFPEYWKERLKFEQSD